MERTVVSIMLCVVFGIRGEGRADDAVPAVLAYDGYLQQNGEPVEDSALRVAFRLFDAESGGRELCAVGFTGGDEITVRVERGQFSTDLLVSGCVDALASSNEWWLAVTLHPGSSDSEAPEVALPHQRLTTVPFAFRAARAMVCEGVAWSAVTGMPMGFADGVDDDRDALGGLACAEGAIAKYDGRHWNCDEDTDTLGSLDCAPGDVPRHEASSAAWVCDPLSDVAESGEIESALAAHAADEAAHHARYDDEEVRDTVGTALRGGANTTVTVDDGGDTITVDVRGLPWDSIGGVPADLADGDDDTLAVLSCDDGQLPVYNGVTGWGCVRESDPTVPSSCEADGQSLEWDGVAWSCAIDDRGLASEVDPTVTESRIDEFVANNGYLTSEADPRLPTMCTGSGRTLEWDGGAWACAIDEGITTIEGVETSTGNVDLVPSGIVTISSDDATDTLTISATETDPTIPASGKASVPVCGTSEVPKFDGSSWNCVATHPTQSPVGRVMRFLPPSGIVEYACGFSPRYIEIRAQSWARNTSACSDYKPWTSFGVYDKSSPSSAGSIWGDSDIDDDPGEPPTNSVVVVYTGMSVSGCGYTAARMESITATGFMLNWFRSETAGVISFQYTCYP